MASLSDILISFFLVVAGVFGLVGSFGLVKLKDTMQRIHAPTKATTLGVGGVLIASMLYFTLVKGSFSFHELLISLFLFITAPITANFIAKTHLTKHVPEEDLPESEQTYGWAVYNDPPE
ncbi:Na+/H+ antiporter subunit G [Aquicoccus porphyridii]|uniref:Na+/H+ antiporter subunit G n=1 Tax=Aquicoccus porphyridii TaxID=1852029 RepID=A0A5A9ZV70_9RHOB|nr:Na+/H+ antiporter subunit G [Aquicoccus porphyridii]KAA0921100.1 Na+/H+ antiporter subunit G [Aquicoccus porphyridii]RAI56366.1 Na+/H+ antiporter subunit G [Rhodobacteraceae bacterium AsT-22]